jgi:phi13 family phage major tail protein
MSPINANAGEYKSRVGLDSLYIAEVTQDDANGYVADTPEYFAPAAEASQEPATSFEVQYADDQPYDVMSAEGPTKITLSVTNIPAEMLAKITGNVFDASTGRVFDHGAIAPYMALMFRSLKSNGKYRYYSYLKGQFTMPKEETTTKGEKPEPKVMQLEYTAIRTVYSFDLGSINGTVKRVYGDEDTTNFSATGWYSQIQTPTTVAPSALALSASDPIDEATDVAITKTCTLTFNNALISNAIYNAALLKRTDESVVAGAISLDITKKIITINPTASLENTIDYIMVYNVIDIYGQHLSGAVSFTTVT